MAQAITLIAPTTAAASSVQFNAMECDQITICSTNNVLGVGETIAVTVMHTSGVQPVYFTGWNSPIAITATPVQAALTGAAGATIFSLTLPGGVLYAFNKSGTALAVGLDVITKPRVGGGAS